MAPSKQLYTGSLHPMGIFKLATLVLVMQLASCLPLAAGFMTPAMIQKMVSQGRPPLTAHVKGTISGQCEEDVANVILNPTEMISVVDAIGKPEAGFMVGNLAWIGHYDQCYSIPDFKYCTTYLQLTLSETQKEPLSWGVCVPESCSNSDVLYSLDDLLSLIEAPFNASSIKASSVLCAEHPPAPYGTGFIATMCILGAIACLMLLGAFLDITLSSVDYKPRPQHPIPPQQAASRGGLIQTSGGGSYESVGEGEREPDGIMQEQQLQEHEDKPTECTRAWHQFLLCFAVNRNIAKIMNGKTGEGSISCLNGIRVMSLMWVMLGHTFAFAQSPGITGNPLSAVSIVGRFGFQAVGNAYFSVDSFFFLSGLLVAYMTLGRMASRNGSIPWFWFYFHRYWRLTPALGMTMLVDLFLRSYVGRGPMWQVIVKDPGCQKYWWTNLLYINNFYGKNECIGWVWYLANDMQFFIISPIILILLYRVPIAGILSLVGLSIVSLITTAVIVAKYNYQAVFMDALNPHQDPAHSFFEDVYIKPYTRIVPYLVGMAIGYFLHKYRNRTFKMHPVVALSGWAVAGAIAMATVYGLYGYFHGHPQTTAGNAIYMGFSKLAWAVSLSWVVVACRFGYGGWINDFLSWDVWIPLSRVTYSAYLLHPFVIYGFFFNHGSTYFYSLYTMAFEFTGLFAISYAAAVMMALFIEFPLANLEKMFMPSNVGKKTN